MGVRRIQSELRWTYNFNLSLATIHKVLKRINAKPLKRKRWRRKTNRYQKDVPGERIQMDTCKIGPGVIQFTAVDDCTRFMFARVYTRRTSANAVTFLDWVFGQTKFPIQRIQTDRGTEFTAYKFVDKLFESGIKWRPIKAVGHPI